MKLLCIVTNFFLLSLCQAQTSADGISKKHVTNFEERQRTALQTLASPKGEAEVTGIRNSCDFRFAAKKATPGVVHINSVYVCEKPGKSNPKTDSIYDPLWEDFWFLFNDPENTWLWTASSSGVIVSDDGYIVTNRHVIEDACEIEIVLNDHRSFKAKVVGGDSLTDVALLKIEAVGLSFIEFGNVNDVEVGDWVLAVGNPYNLNSTVTAGIISAKARDISLIQTPGAIESFIQTDAAINLGNSGGALVDINGKLIGINSAIATPTGTYAGYSFAIPVDLVVKVIDDLLLYGKVLRGYLGISIRTMTAKDAEDLGMLKPLGVFVEKVNKASGGAEAGINVRDVITKIEGQNIENGAQVNEIIGTCKPGDIVTLTYLRKGLEKEVRVKLK